MPLANLRAFAEGFVRGRTPPSPTPPNHLARWTREQEDEALRLFAAGHDPDVIGSLLGRTTGAINARLANLLGVQYPDTPVQYRRRGQPITRRDERSRRVPRTTIPEEPPRTSVNWQRVEALNPDWPTSRALDVLAGDWSMFPPLVSDEPARPRRGTNQETPDHLAPQLQLHRAQYEKLAEAIKSVRPEGDGRVAAGKNSALNQVAYRMAALFEGEGSTFDRAKWLEACGVKGESHGP